MAHLHQHPLGAVVRQKIQVERGMAMGLDLVAQQVRDGIDQTALHPCRCDHKLAPAAEAAALAVGEIKRDGLERLARKTLGKNTRLENDSL